MQCRPKYKTKVEIVFIKCQNGLWHTRCWASWYTESSCSVPDLSHDRQRKMWAFIGDGRVQTGLLHHHESIGHKTVRYSRTKGRAGITGSGSSSTLVWFLGGISKEENEARQGLTQPDLKTTATFSFTALLTSGWCGSHRLCHLKGGKTVIKINLWWWASQRLFVKYRNKLYPHLLVPLKYLSLCPIQNILRPGSSESSVQIKNMFILATELLASICYEIHVITWRGGCREKPDLTSSLTRTWMPVGPCLKIWLICLGEMLKSWANFSVSSAAVSSSR